YDADVPQSLTYPDGTLLDFLKRHAAERPEATALIFKGRRMSWRTLDRASDACGAALASLGVRAGDKVALILPTCPQWVIAQLGIWKIGAVVAALNPIYTEHELGTLLRATGARFAIALTRVYSRVKAVQPQTALEMVVATNIKEYLPRHLAALFTLFKEKKEGHRIQLAPGDRWLQDLLHANRGAAPPTIQQSGDDEAIVLASGGTTGTPKGVIGLHRAFVYAGTQLDAWTKSSFDSGRDIVLLPLPLCHVYANVGGLGLGFVSGSPLALVPNPRDLADVLKTIHTVRPAFMMGVPTLFQAMLNNPAVQKGRINFSSLKVSFSGAAALMAATKQQFEALTGGRIIEGYSLTEGMMACLVNPMKGQAKLGSIGLPLPNVEARIVDAEHGSVERGPREEGELVLSAPQLMKGYWRNTDETALSLRRGPDGRVWLHTGDIGYMDEDGYVFLTDRKKDLIKTSGYQVWPREVEEVLSQHQAIAEAGVAGVPDSLRGEAVKAWVVLRAGHQVGEDELRRFCREQLAPFKVPLSIEFRTELPKSLVGKILRRELVRQHVSAA
ncbi:MAG TPA: AMP-binding protein, partial [Chloroflexota bacterium]|nr:AMP-binding protein [Chloroflexota bacterium]